MICHRCGQSGAGLRYGAAWWFHPMCWQLIRHDHEAVRRICESAGNIGESASLYVEYLTSGAKVVVNSEEIGPAQRATAEPTLTIRPTGEGMTMAIPHLSTADSGRGR